MDKIPEVPAFKSKLEPYSEPHGLYEFGNHENVIVRPLDWVTFLTKGRFRPERNGKSISAEEFAHITKRHFDELATYGIDAPVSFVVAEVERKSVPKEEVFAIVKRVEKIENPDKQELGRAFAHVRSALLRYYGDKFEHGGSFLADLSKDTQYVYGTVEGGIPGAHLVDVDPFIYGGGRALYRVLTDLKRIIGEERLFFATPEYNSLYGDVMALYAKVENSVPTV